MLSALFGEVIVPQYVYRETIDEIYARSVADQMGLRTAGSLGILVKAYRKGNLTLEMLEELLATIENREDIWIHPGLCGDVRREVLDL